MAASAASRWALAATNANSAVFEFVAPLVNRLLADVPPLHEGLRTRIIGSRKIQVALALGDQRNSFRQCLFGLQYLGLRAPELGLGFRR